MFALSLLILTATVWATGAAAALTNSHVVSQAVKPAETAAAASTGSLGLVPWPKKLERGEGSFRLTPQTSLLVERAFTNEGCLLQQGLASLAGFCLASNTAAGARPGTVRLVQRPASPGGPEAYALQVSRQQVTLSAAEPVGMLRAITTLMQLVPVGPATEGDPCELPCVQIEDAPRFGWRGLLLDCSRTFQSPAYLRQTIDRLAAYKLNILHLHLTDDQGWRFEVRKYPALTQKGARFSPKYNEPEAHQGFYTRQQLHELVDYATRRGVTLVPEIEMPGHSVAALVCYPELSCSGKLPEDIYPFSKGPTITADILCAGNEETYKFLESVLDEVVEAFPSTFIHIGGDEAPKERWKACAKCQARIQAEHLKDEHELQSYFVRRVERLLTARGRRLIGWSEILQGGLAPNAAVMDWIGGAAQATDSGHDAVMSPTTHCYFDYPYEQISSQRVYSFDPVAGLAPERVRHILGLQANFWSHLDREPQLVDKKLFPRLVPLAERAWSPAENRDWAEFKPRLEAQLPRLRQMGVSYFPEPFNQR